MISLLDWLRGACVGPLLRLRIAAEPLPTPRPRVSRFGAYYPKSFEVFRAEAQRQLAVQAAAQVTKDARAAGLLDGNLAVVADVAFTRPRTGRLSTPRCDADNAIKWPLDACTKVGIWGDDSQVAVLAIHKRYSEQTSLADPQRSQEAGGEAGVDLWVGKLA